jgi:flagellar hook-length control protein FliK
MVLRLHPAELGSLRIELMVEGDKVRANLHAQTQQVQEVLERNLGQLRNALAEQGLKIDHFQVSSDARQNQQQGQAEDLTHQRRQAEQSARNKRDKEEPLSEDRTIPLAHLIQNGGRGISLHV